MELVGFKTGDRVKLITLKQVGAHAPHLKIGDVGIIQGNFMLPELYIVIFENIGPNLRNNYAFESYELELVISKNQIN